jgi:hypothetical protein
MVRRNSAKNGFTTEAQRGREGGFSDGNPGKNAGLI